MPYIGIKLANGDFFPILNENSNAYIEESIELTTIRENQESVQINLFRKMDGLEPEYIGSLIIEDISPDNAGNPTINLKIKLDEEKNLSAEAVNIDSGVRQSLKVSLENLSEGTISIPDFDLTSFDKDINDFSDDPYSKDVFDTEKEDEQLFEYTDKNKKPLWPIILAVILGISLLIAAILFLTKNLSKSSKPAVEITQEPTYTDSVDEPIEPETSSIMDTLTEEPPAPSPEPVAEIKEIPPEPMPVPPVQEEKEPEKEPTPPPPVKKPDPPEIMQSGIVKYTVKEGDTLWDISETFYKTPWLYKKIAKHNKIKNAHIIIPGAILEIPPK